MKNFGKFLLGLAVVAAAFTSCEKEELLTEMEIEQNVGLKSAHVQPVLDSVLDFDYIGNGNYLAAGIDENGEPSYYFGKHSNWEKRPYGKTEQNIWGKFIAAEYNYEGRWLVYAYLNTKLQEVVVNGGVISKDGEPTFYSGKNRFYYEVKAKNEVTGRWEKTGEKEYITEFLDLDYSPTHEGFIFSGKTETGREVTFFSSAGKQGTWKYVSQGAGEAWGEYIDAAFGKTSAGWSGIYCYKYSRDGYVVTNGIYGNKKGPKFFRGKKHVGPKGDRLVEVIDLDYNPVAQNYVITGISENGGLATYYGNHKAWTKYTGSNSPKQVVGSEKNYKAVAFPDAEDKLFLYLHDSSHKGGICSNGGNTTYKNQPRHNKGATPVR